MPPKRKRSSINHYDSRQQKLRREARKRAVERVAARLQDAHDQRIARQEEVQATLDVSSTQLQCKLFSLPTELRTVIFELALEDEPCPEPGPIIHTTEHGLNYYSKTPPPGWEEPPHDTPQPWCVGEGCRKALECNQFGNAPGRINITATGIHSLQSQKGKLFAYRRFASLNLLQTCKRAYVEALPIVYGNGKTWSFIQNPGLGRNRARDAPSVPNGTNYFPPGLAMKTTGMFLTRIGAVAMTFLENISITLNKVWIRLDYRAPSSTEAVFAQLRECTQLRRLEMQLCSHGLYRNWPLRSTGTKYKKFGVCIVTMTSPGHLDEMIDIARRFWMNNDGHRKPWDIPISQTQEEKHSNHYSSTFGNIEVVVKLNPLEPGTFPTLRHRTFYKEGLQGDSG